VRRCRSDVESQAIADDETRPPSMMMWRRLLTVGIHRHLWILFLCLVTLSSCAGVQRPKDPVQSATEHHTRALQYLSIGAAEGAIKELQEALKLDPTNAEHYHLLAFAYHYEGRYQFALANYAKALELAPSYAEAHVHLAGLYLELARWDEALAQGREALKITAYQHPEIAYNTIGLAYMGKGDLVSARRAFRDALAFHENFPEAHRNLGTLYFQQGQVEDAIREFREAVRLRPSYAEALHDLGVAYLERGSQAEAVAQFHKVIQLDPESELAEVAKWYLGALP
jgi:Tfp pilus assembly protein PilF